MVSDMFRISKDTLEEINSFLLDPGNPDVQALLRVVAKFGTPKRSTRRQRMPGA